MQTLKRWLTTVGLILGALLGYQVQRPPILETPAPTSQTSPTPAPTVSPSNDVANVVIGQMKNADVSQQEQIVIAAGYVRQVLTSDCLELGILKTIFTETNGLTNGQIYHKFIDTKHTLNYSFFYGSRWQNYMSKTVGYDIGDGVVYMNSFYVKDAKTIMSLTFHELAHGLDFRHDGTKATSVPYKMNEISEACLAVIQGK
jgi:hypothetical protein